MTIRGRAKVAVTIRTITEIFPDLEGVVGPFCKCRKDGKKKGEHDLIVTVTSRSS